MKKFSKYLIPVAATLFLVGCFPNERGDLIDDAKKAYANGDNATAYELLIKAKKIEEFSAEPEEASVNEMFQGIVNTLYVEYYNTGNIHFDLRDYTKAYESYAKANRIHSVDTTLTTKIKETESLIKEQEAFDIYTDFFSKGISDSNELLNDFNGTISDYYLGEIDAIGFSEKAKQLIVPSNEILGSFDDVHSIINEHLYDTHTSFSALVNYQHETFIQGVSLENGSTDMNKIYERYTHIKKQQSDMVQRVKSYADSRKLKANLVLSKTNSSSEPVEDLSSNTTNLEDIVFPE